MLKTKKIIWIGISLLILMALSAFLFPSGGTLRMRRATALRISSGLLLSSLGSDIERYIECHQQRPKHLADIVRNCSNDADQAVYFIIPGRRREAEARFAASTNTFLYEDYSNYLLDTNQNSEILIYEKPGIRNDDIIYYYKKGFGVWKLKQEEFRKCLEIGKYPPPLK